jgi:hypothetical protein
VSGSAGLEIVAKQLELLKETVPKAHRVAILSNPANAVPPTCDKRSERRGRVVGRFIAQ